jgi:hypothetical protein
MWLVVEQNPREGFLKRHGGKFALLLAIAASLISFSYDADAEDDIPPVRVELKFLPQAPSFSQSTPHSSAPLAILSFSASNFGAPALDIPSTGSRSPQLSPKLSLTLRC